MSKKQSQKKRYDIGLIHSSFTENLESLRVFVNNLAPVVRRQDQAIIEKTRDTARKIAQILLMSKADVKKAKGTSKSLKATRQQMQQVARTLKDLPRLSPRNVQLLHKSAFVMLVSYFDFLLSDLLHYFYRKHPESLYGKDLVDNIKRIEAL